MNLDGYFVLRFRQAHRTVRFALVPGADMASLGAADAVFHREGADRAGVLLFILGHRVSSVRLSPRFRQDRPS